MHEARRTERRSLNCVRGLATDLHDRAWTLIEGDRRSPGELLELVDLARASRMLWRLAEPCTDAVEHLRAHQLVAIAAARAGDTHGAFDAARLAAGSEWTAHDHATPRDRAMTLAAMLLAHLTRPGYHDPEPALRAIGALPRPEREVFRRILPYPERLFAHHEQPEEPILASSCK